jgi:hypothetical protein
LGANATLSQTMVRAEPGGQSSFLVTVRNTGTVVDQFTVEVLGSAAGWATVTPPTVSLFPGADGQATVTFNPPRTADVAAGEIPFAVKVTSHEDPEGSIVEEGVLVVGTFADLFAELLPRTARGRRSARYDMALDNRGNDRVNAVLSAIEPDERLRFTFQPPAVVAEPDTATFSQVVARPVRTFWRGSAVTIPFKIVVEPEGVAPLVVDGTMLQEPRLPRWFWKAVLLVLVLLLLLVVLWFALLKPTVESAAKDAAEDAVEEPLAQTEEALQDLAAKVGAAPPEIAGAGGEGEGGTATEDPAGAQPGSGALAGDLGAPFDHRLAVSGSGVTDDAFDVPDDQTFSLTDVVFQNPAGDSGTVELRRDDIVLIRVNMANFRDLDYHFVSPIVIGQGHSVSLHVECGGGSCSPAAYLTGFLKQRP